MKKIIITLSLLLVTLTLQAQEKNEFSRYEIIYNDKVLQQDTLPLQTVRTKEELLITSNDISLELTIGGKENTREIRGELYNITKVLSKKEAECVFFMRIDREKAFLVDENNVTLVLYK